MAQLILSHSGTITRQTNNFDFLRFVAAVFVIISHSYDLLGIHDQELLMTATHTYFFSALGLICFFTISGFLVTQSLFGSLSVIQYGWKRLLRIVPALALVMLVSMFIIGPCFTDLPLGDYFSSAHLYSYLRNLIFIGSMQWDLPGVFANNPIKNTNGSLWTLTIEGRLYIVLAVVSLFEFPKKKWIVLTLFALLVAASPWFGDLFKSNPLPFYFSLYFFAGVTAFLFKDKIIYTKWLALLSVAIIASVCFFKIIGTLNFIAFPYLILYLAQLKSPLNHFAKYGDFSYGLFLFAYPVQQCIVDISKGHIPVAAMIPASILFTLPFAILSWKLVESKALRYKYLIK